MEAEPTLGEVLEAVKDGFGLMDEKFERVDERFDRLEHRMDRMEGRMDRQEGKLNVLVNVLQEKKVISEADKRVVHA